MIPLTYMTYLVKSIRKKADRWVPGLREGARGVTFPGDRASVWEDEETSGDGWMGGMLAQQCECP